MKTNTLFRLAQLAVTPLAIASTFALVSPNKANAADLGAAQGFNLFILGDVTQSNTDVQGKAAVGGNVNYTNFAIQSGLPNSTSDALIVGGNINLMNGTVNGNIVSANPYTPPQGVTVTGSVMTGTPIDFAAAGTYLTNLSQSLFNTGATGSTTIDASNGVTLTGTNADLNVFNLSEAAIENASSLTINAPGTSTAVVNVAGANISLQNFETFLKGIGTDKVLFNFNQATSLASTSLSFKGSVLAPIANLMLNNGHIDGTLIGASLNGNLELHTPPFNGELPPPVGNPPAPPSKVPEPTTLAGLGLVGMLLAGARRKAKQTA